MYRNALFAHDRKYRVYLVRKWNAVAKPRTVCWILYHPGGSDEKKDDRVLYNLIAHSREWGYDQLRVVSLLPLFNVNKADARSHFSDIWGRPDFQLRDLLYENLELIAKTAKRSELTVAAWGNPERHVSQAEDAIERILTGEPPFPDIHCLGIVGNNPKVPVSYGGTILPHGIQPTLFKRGFVEDVKKL